MTQAAWLFVYLNILDLLTTVIFLRLGIKEGVFITQYFISHLGVWPGLIAVKIISIGVLMLAVIGVKHRMINYGVILYGAVVVWNLLAIMGQIGAFAWH